MKPVQTIGPQSQSITNFETGASACQFKSDTISDKLYGLPAKSPLEHARSHNGTTARTLRAEQHADAADGRLRERACASAAAYQLGHYNL